MDNESINNARTIFINYDFIMTTDELHKAKLYYANIKYLLDNGYIEKLKQGYYHWIEDSYENDIIIINKLFPDAIISMESALYYYNYSDNKPLSWDISLNKNVSKTKDKVEYKLIKIHKLEPYLYSLGETTGEIDSVTVKIYDRDRTICDILRNMNKLDKKVVTTAIKSYLNDPNKNVDNLLCYAKIMHINKRVNDLIGIWL